MVPQSFSKTRLPTSENKICKIHVQIENHHFKIQAKYNISLTVAGEGVYNNIRGSTCTSSTSSKMSEYFFLFNFLQNVSKNKNKNNQLKIVQVFVRSKLYFFNKMNCSSNSSNRFICKTISYIPEAILFTSIKLKFSYELM